MGITQTVRFDVGGIIYNVARSLLEQHPNTVMAKMASAVWNGEPPSSDSSNVGEKDAGGATLFIDGNGERFQYVLDYMRRGRVALPGGKISKASLLEDLDYYGFENVSSDSIQMEFLMVEAVKCLGHMEKYFNAALSRERKIQEHKMECMEFIEICFRTFLATRNCRLAFWKDRGDENEKAYYFCQDVQHDKGLKQIMHESFRKLCGWKVRVWESNFGNGVVIESYVPDPSTG